MIPNGLYGGAAVVAEVTYGTAPASGYVWLPVIPGTGPKPKIERIERESLGQTPELNPPKKLTVVEGELKTHLNMSDASNGVVLRACGVRTGSVAPFLYTCSGVAGTGNPPTTNSLTLLLDYGIQTLPSTHYQVAITGMKPTKVVWEFEADKRPTQTVSYIGQGWAVQGSPVAISAPSDSAISVPSDFTTCLLGGSAFGFKKLTLTLNLPKSGPEQNRFGATAMAEPASTGLISIEGALSADFSNDTGYNYIQEYADWLSGSTFGTFSIGTVGQVRFQMTSAYVAEGGTPVLTAGLTQTNPIIRCAELLINCAA